MSGADLGFDQRGAEPTVQRGLWNVFTVLEMVFSEVLRRHIFIPLIYNLCTTMNNVIITLMK